MKWMLIVSGLLAACAAFALLRAWAGKGKSNKGEVSLMATVKRILPNGEGQYRGVFIARGQEVEFAIPAHIARQLQPGERGVLTYRGGEFVYFVPRQQLFEAEGESQLRAVS